MENMSNSLTIGAPADAAGASVETIRLHQHKGLLQETERPQGSIHRYSDPDVGRVRYIKAAQRIGFTLDEITQLLQLEGGTQCWQARDIAEHKLADVRRRIGDLQRMEFALADLVERCAAGRGKVPCPLIISLREMVGGATCSSGRRAAISVGQSLVAACSPLILADGPQSFG